jgi:tetratricopeptide (TPR) repeat protein
MIPMKKHGRIAKAEAAADEAVRRATAAIQNGRPNDAERMLNDLLSNSPRLPVTLHALGLALLAQRRPREAIAPLEEAARHGANPVIETNLAVALKESGRAADALTWLERATTRQPPFEHAFRELGELLFSLRRLDEAEAVLKRGLTVAPNSAELSILLGGIFLDRADRDNAKLAFARALVNAPAHPRALYGIGTALMLEGEFGRAAERFRLALAQDPADFQIRLSLGTCLLELGRAEEALASMRDAVAIAPRSYAQVLKLVVTSGRGRFWLRPSAAAKRLRAAKLAWTALALGCTEFSPIDPVFATDCVGCLL